MKEKPESYDIFALVDKLRAKDVNSNFLATIEDRFVANKTLSAVDFYHLRRLAAEVLDVDFMPAWARGIRVIRQPQPEPIYARGLHDELV